MVHTKTPFRISFMGGRSDLPSFYEKEEGFVVSASIDKFLNIYLSKEDSHHYWLQYAKEELTTKIEDIEHPIIRQIFLDYPKIKDWGGLKLMVESDIPSGTGLGSSSAFCVGLLKAIQYYHSEDLTKKALAEMASSIEIEKLGSFIGKQDQYCAAFGGFNKMRFLKNGEVEVEKISLADSSKLENSLCVFFTGIQRDGSKVLEKERKEISVGKIAEMRDLAKSFAYELEKNSSLKRLGEILSLGWQIKYSLNPSISNGKIQAWYEKALASGAYGGKLLGAGGGGYLLFLCPSDKQKDLELALSDLKRLPVKFYDKGSEYIKEV